MANAITTAKVYLAMLDAVYAASSKTQILDNEQWVREGAQAGEMLIPKMVIQGLGDYSRANGFVNGDVTLTWETHALTQDRGRSFQIDNMDNMETIDTAFGQLAGEFIRTKVVAEIDAYRIAKLASKAGTIATPATLTTSTAAAAVDEAIAAMNEAEVPEEERVLFVTPQVYKFISQSTDFVKNLNGAAGTGIDNRFSSYNGIPVSVIPQTRMYTKLTMLTGATGQEAGGYTKDGTTGKDINFILVHRPSVLGVTKHIEPRIFTPEQNQDADAYKFQYRIYHDLFVPDNKTKGIYLHNKA